MNDLSLPIITSCALSAAFGVAGILQLTGTGMVRRAYLRWDYPARAFRLIGAMQLLAGVLLATSSGRPLGIALAAAVNFLAVVLLLKNREYLLALPGLAITAALPLTLLPIS